MTRTLLVILFLAAALCAAVMLVAVAGEKDGKAFLGVVAGEVTSDVAADYGVKAGGGVIVEGVTSKSPADEAGLRENDIIVKLNGSVVTGPEEFRRQIRQMKPGDTAELEYVRGGQTRTVKIKLAEREERAFGLRWDDDGERRFRFEGMPWEWHWESDDKEDEDSEPVAFAGIVTQSLSKGLAQFFKVEEGALISEVIKESPAEKAGLKAGDVIVKIGTMDVEDENDVRRAIHEHKPGDAVEFVVMRDGNRTTITVTLGKQDNLLGSGIRRIPIGDKCIDLHSERLVPSPEDMDRLRDELRKVEIQIHSLPALPDLNVNVHPELDRLRVDVRRVEAISSSSVHESLRDFYNRLARKIHWLGRAIEHQKQRLQKVGTRLIDALA